MDARLNHLNSFYQRMSDVRISRHPDVKTSMLIMNDKFTDQYGDSHTDEVFRIPKQIILKLHPDLSFLQEFEEDLLDELTEPFKAIITLTDLPRNPRAADRILTSRSLYTIAAVKPMNRYLNQVFECLLYPERTETDPLKIYDIRFYDENNQLRDYEYCRDRHKSNLSIVYGGFPTEMKLNDQPWEPFKQRFRFHPKNELQIQIRDSDNNVSKITFGDAYQI